MELTWPTTDWHRLLRMTGWAAVLLLIAFNLGNFGLWLTSGAPATDWWTLQQAATHAGTPELYANGLGFGYRWSPLAAWPLGWLPPLPVWIALHFAVLPLFRDWRIVLLVLAFPPFWFDLQAGNVMIFVVLAAWWALRGNRLGIGIYLALLLFMPRPLMVPLGAWLLWRQPEWRLPFLGMFAVHAGLVAWTELGDEWLRRLTESSSELGHPLNWGASRFIGVAWLPIGAALAVFLTWKGRLGLASLAAAPYLFPYYFLFLVLDLNDAGQREGVVGGPRLRDRVSHHVRAFGSDIHDRRRPSHQLGDS